VLRAIQRHAGYVFLDTMLDELKFLGGAALRFGANFNGMADGHDEFLLPGWPGLRQP
jgi:hypothetical protein